MDGISTFYSTAVTAICITIVMAAAATAGYKQYRIGSISYTGTA